MASRRKTRALVVVVALAVIVVGGFFAFNAWLDSDDAPAAFAASDDLGANTGDTADAGPAPTDAPASGEWTVELETGSDAGVGYRIVEDVPVGDPQEIVARTQQVTGSVTLDGTSLSAAEFVLPVDSLASDNTMRDGAVAGTYLESGTFPTASLVVSDSIAIEVAEGTKTAVPFSVEGDLTLHGVTSPVTVNGTAAWSADLLEIVGTVDLTLGQFGIERPDLLGRSARNEAVVEFKLRFVSA